MSLALSNREREVAQLGDSAGRRRIAL